ncbi:uncharacterized protein GGS22DRAFT_126676 [Annulohypoxylon maeteangense]|uniref:uncharacterized protein n=1 Tax=Annulohypoxylon maeteangense TaxID=1927788 RepID=UPI0020089899|nr:uncharacterized protein GGS22DRAFT_126676 [Annulohypoxylon maeteangense]KAI0886261.1 hypothetical protein GGS22DRAFT_126676 [Annulohypoxylon maeteangense]
MNQIRAIQALNKREIENGVPPEASWHTDYRDTAFVNFGGLPYELSEGDIITIFSQFGEPVFLKLARDKETGKSKGFGWLKYEDQRSTDLAVDNLGGAEISGRLVRVDHARYKARDDEDPEEFKISWEDIVRREKAEKGEDVEMQESSEEEEERRPMIKEERELAKLLEEHDEDDPMKGFLIEEKKKEVERALRKEGERKERKEKKEKHRHHHSHRSKRDDRDRYSEERDHHRRPRRDRTPVAKDRGSRERDETPPRRRDNSTDRERRRGDDNRDRHRDKEHRRDRDDRDRHSKRSRYNDDEDREKNRDRDRDRKSRRRSRSRSPRSYRD